MLAVMDEWLNAVRYGRGCSHYWGSGVNWVSYHGRCVDSMDVMVDGMMNWSWMNSMMNRSRMNGMMKRGRMNSMMGVGVGHRRRCGVDGMVRYRVYRRGDGLAVLVQDWLGQEGVEERVSIESVQRRSLGTVDLNRKC